MSGTEDTDDTKPTDASLSDYVDGLLSSEEAEDMEVRLGDDPALQGELDDLSTTLELLRRLPEQPAPAELKDAIQARIRRRMRASDIADLQLSRFPFEAAFNILLVVVLIFFYLSAETWESAEPIPSEPDVVVVSDQVESVLRRLGAVKVSPRPTGTHYRVQIAPRNYPVLVKRVKEMAELGILSAKRNADGQFIVELFLRAK